jgi:membrane protein DedA with SNARE-associated domain
VSEPDVSTGLISTAAGSARSRAEALLPHWRKILVIGVGGVAVLWIAPTIIAALGSIDIEGIERPYLLTFLFVWWDAIIPIFPSESILNTASTLIAAGDIDLELGWLILAGSVGAILGDTTLYWLARTVGRQLLGDKVERAKQDPRISSAFEILSMSAPLVLVAGRFVPGLRFVIGSTMGLERYPYPRFLLYTAIGGTLWATFNCGLSYLIGSKLGEYAVISLLFSFAITSALLGFLYVRLKRKYERAQTEGTMS